MKTNKAIPTKEELNKEYANLCSQLGDAEYHIRRYKLLIQELHSKIDIINKISGELNSKEQKGTESE